MLGVMPKNKSSMVDFPKISELPSVLKTDEWKWELFETPSNPSYEFWIGTDANGSKWITKLKGGFSGYREIVFGHLAQKMGWSCQTSVFAIFDEKSLEKLQIKKDNKFHAVHWFMSEHSFGRCTDNCPFPLRDDNIPIEKLKNIPVKNILDWPKSDFAACIFGAGEPSGKFFTASHEFVIIDSEQMFSSAPGNLEETAWDTNVDVTESQATKELKLELKLETCRNISELSESFINKILEVPNDIHFTKPWSIKDRIKESHQMAKSFLRRD